MMHIEEQLKCPMVDQQEYTKYMSGLDIGGGFVFGRYISRSV